VTAGSECISSAVASPWRKEAYMKLHDEIEVAAYELCVSRGCIPGRDLDDWLAAERIVLARHAGQDMEEPEEEAEEASEETAEVKKKKITEESEVEVYQDVSVG
jgi:hypothetical protein